MDMIIWTTTILLEFILIGAMIRKQVLSHLPWFFICIAFSASESIPLASVVRHYTTASPEYYYTYYAFDLVNIMLYCTMIRECWRIYGLRVVSVTAGAYLAMKTMCYAVMAIGWTAAANSLHGSLRFANIALYAFWAYRVYRL